MDNQSPDLTAIVSIAGANGKILDILSDSSIVVHQQDKITEAAQIFFRELERMSKTKLSDLAHVTRVTRTAPTSVSVEFDSLEACADFFNKNTVGEAHG